MNTHRRIHRALVACAFAFLALSVARAAEESGKPTEAQLAFEAANKAAQHGPKDVKLGKQATLKLKEGYVYVPPKESGRLLKAMGNHIDDSLLGTVWPGSDENWFVVARYVDEGYIKDDDAKDWNADELLQSLKDGTEEGNKDRRARGMSELQVIGWVEKPHYDAAAHQLVWSVATKHKGEADTAQQGINYNTYALGRSGYISMNLVTDRKLIGEYKNHARVLLAGLAYDAGNGYGDFNESTDKVAAYGLAALVGGVAAKKLGLLAAVGVFFAKFWKIVAVAVFGAGGIFGKYFKRKPKPTATA